MAIKYNGQDLQQRIIDWYPVQRVMYNWVQIRPTWPAPIGDGIYWNQSEWLISIKWWQLTSWITLADKNLWATQICERWDTFSQANVWNWYQRGNNYWFPYSMWTTWPSSISYTQIDASAYWPWNYYSSSTWIDSFPLDTWDSSNNTDLRWYDSFSISGDYIAIQWPCPNGWHIPTNNEYQDIVQTQFPNLAEYLKMEAWGYINNTWTQGRPWRFLWLLWCCDAEYTAGQYRTYHGVAYSSDWTLTINWTWGNLNWCPIRPFKNTPVVPDSTRTVLYQPS
jgi:hypothetical protein